jgi:Reverse transcriptase (RNA-dependent DNA polymerase)
MGPDKAPGPDGFTVRFVLKAWGMLGQEIVSQVQDAFRTDQAPSSWMLSHLVLIPKVENSAKPTHFRPLSVCSVFHWLLTKVIANRIKLILLRLISSTQTTFLKGRSIQENVLLMNEVVHSFGRTELKEKAFALKADLFKAFDTLDWRYLGAVLRKFGFPQPLTNLILSCVTGLKFTIKLNGETGGGFISPGRGLRQGCPLSPYLFILSMDLLSGRLTNTQNQGELKGLTLTAEAPTITHSMYADDLVRFGLAEEREVKALSEIMKVFGVISRLKINNDKSVIWFSKNTTERGKRQVFQTFPAKLPDDLTTYLEYHMPKGRVTSKHYKKMEDNTIGKLGDEHCILYHMLDV